MIQTAYGIVHGRIIQFDKDLGVADGQKVEVTIKSIPAKEAWGEGLKRCAGALASEWSEEDDRILEEIYRDRKRDTRREIPQ